MGPNYILPIIQKLITRVIELGYKQLIKENLNMKVWYVTARFVINRFKSLVLYLFWVSSLRSVMLDKKGQGGLYNRRLWDYYIWADDWASSTYQIRKLKTCYIVTYFIYLYHWKSRLKIFLIFHWTEFLCKCWVPVQGLVGSAQRRRQSTLIRDCRGAVKMTPVQEATTF